MLTKSDFLKYIQCPKYLWLYKHRKDLLPTEVDANLQHIFDEGYHVEAYAYQLFPSGIEAQVEGFAESIAKTKDLMTEKVRTIYQPTICAKDLFCRADIIKLNEDGETWDIYEVKSSTEVKDINIHDLAFQKICFEGAGYRINKVHLVYINNQYVRQGDIASDQLLHVEDVTQQVQYLEADTCAAIKTALAIIKQSDEPVVRILKQCRDPFTCTFLDYCWRDIPEHSIYEIAGGLNETKLNLLIDDGVLQIKDIPDEILTSKKALRHQQVLKNDLVYIEHDNIQAELDQLQYPLYFLDYETNAAAVPLFDGYRPYQRMVFQYSLHVQTEVGGELKHFAYLAKTFAEPSLGLAEQLRHHIGNTGTVIAWNMSFEQGCNTEMGQRHPEFMPFFEDINNRMFDLMQVFRKGYYVHKDFHGSSSIKKVLPVLVPDLSYADLAIHEGTTASNKWRELIDPKTSATDREQVYNNMLSYCELDTLAMVKILDELYKIIA